MYLGIALFSCLMSFGIGTLGFIAGFRFAMYIVEHKGKTRYEA